MHETAINSSEAVVYLNLYLKGQNGLIKHEATQAFALTIVVLSAVLHNVQRPTATEASRASVQEIGSDVIGWRSDASLPAASSYIPVKFKVKVKKHGQTVKIQGPWSNSDIVP